MNKPLRRVAIAVMVMVVALLANATYVQVIKADSLRNDPRNQRVLINEYSRQRGQISAAGQVLASSVPTDDRYKYLRVYPSPPQNPSSALAEAPVTGFYSMQYSSTMLEHAEDSVLNGSDDRLFGARLFDMVSGRSPRGGNVVTTIDPVVQQVAYNQLASKGLTGSVVAIQPTTGAILAMASTPSYDPNRLASHDAQTRTQAWESLTNDPRKPMLNRAISATYPPGSTFKVITSAAALSHGATPEDQFTAASGLKLPGTDTILHNYDDEHCGPAGPNVSMDLAFALSCNAAYAQIGIKTGKQAIEDQATAFGVGQDGLKIPLPVADSTLGTIPDAAALGQASIGQRNVAFTPLQNAVIAATVANGGVRMRPYLVKQLQAPDLSNLSTTAPTSEGQAVSPEVAATLTKMMIDSENHTAYANDWNGPQIASKTGTAEHGADPKQTPPDCWYIGFAPANNPQVAVAVLVENGGNRGLAGTGGFVASPIGRAVMAAAMRGQ